MVTRLHFMGWVHWSLVGSTEVDRMIHEGISAHVHVPKPSKEGLLGVYWSELEKRDDLTTMTILLCTAFRTQNWCSGP